MASQELPSQPEGQRIITSPERVLGGVAAIAAGVGLAKYGASAENALLTIGGFGTVVGGILLGSTGIDHTAQR